MSDQKSRTTFIYILLACCLVSIAVSFYRFYIKKNFDYIVETSCDKSSQTCFFRDCSDPNTGCPPDNLSYYRKYTIRAVDFPICGNEDCTVACANKLIECKPIECTDAEINDGSCVPPVATQ